MSKKSKNDRIYASSFLVDPTLVGPTVSNVPEGAELNQSGKDWLASLNGIKARNTRGLITHFCLMPMSRLKKIPRDHEHIAQTDMCIFGGCIAEGMYVGNSSVTTSPVVMFSQDKTRVLTQSGSIYQVRKEVTEKEILAMFPGLLEELREE